MQIAFPVILTIIVALYSWRLSNFFWRMLAVAIAALLFSNLAYILLVWLNPDSEIINWKGIVIDGSFSIAFGVGIYIVFIIQIIKKIKGRNKT